MGVKLLWTGVTIWVALPMMTTVHQAPMVGAIFMVIGMILLWLDR